MIRFDRIHAWLLGVWRRVGFGWALLAAVLLAVGVWWLWFLTR